MLSMRENWLLVGWACMEISYSLAEHARKLVTLWLSMRENWLLVGWAYEEICFYWYWTMFFPLSSVPLSPFFIPCLTSYVSCLKWLFLVSHPLFPSLTSLFLVSHPLFHVSLLCSLSSSVPNLTSLFLVSRSLSPILSLCSLYRILLSRRFVVLYWFHIWLLCNEIVSEYA